LNCVRKHCERLKGGRLARLVGAGDEGRAAARIRSVGAPRSDAHARSRVLALVVSDVLGDPLDVISSGPLAPDPTTYADAIGVLERRATAGHVPSVVAHLRAGVRGEHDETPKPGDAAFDGVVSTIISSNQTAAIAARDTLLDLGFRVKVVCRVEGEAGAIGRGLVGDAIAESAAADASFAVVYAGETTVDVGDATGLGGRNQELALAAGIELEGLAHLGARVCVATLATDGIDGPTDTAGAVVDSHTGALARERGVDLGGALARHDSHAALGALGLLVRTGPSGTNVNDAAIAMVYLSVPRS
ncbi:MAG: DUF4147 domain-containing protein, partial [Phycisphaerales bacterium]|nr:DUF4147 domain-containing protein [Phycisphaerales bacterium]